MGITNVPQTTYEKCFSTLWIFLNIIFELYKLFKIWLFGKNQFLIKLVLISTTNKESFLMHVTCLFRLFTSFKFLKAVGPNML
jgi:hypothetical protein